MATELFLEIERWFGIRLAMSEIMEHPTVAKLAALLGRQSQTEANRCLLHLQVKGGGTPLFAPRPTASLRQSSRPCTARRSRIAAAGSHNSSMGRRPPPSSFWRFFRTTSANHRGGRRAPTTCGSNRRRDRGAHASSCPCAGNGHCGVAMDIGMFSRNKQPPSTMRLDADAKFGKQGQRNWSVGLIKCPCRYLVLRYGPQPEQGPLRR